MSDIKTFTMKQHKRIGIQQRCRHGNGFVEIYTWDQAGTEIVTRYNFGEKLSGIGSTRVVRRPPKYEPKL